MRVNKEIIITLVAFLAVAGALGAGYQFYFKGLLQKYQSDEKERDRLKTQLQSLEGAFFHYQPEQVLAVWRGQVQPWKAAVASSASFFTVGDLFEAEPVPEGKLARFHYEDEYRRKFGEFQRAAWEHNPPCLIGANVFAGFGAPDPAALQGVPVTNAETDPWLRSISFGCAMTRLLIEGNAETVRAVELWPKRSLEYGGLLELWTVGFGFTMRAEDLVDFLEKLRTSDRYFNVNAISIQNTDLLSPFPPALNVQMLLTQAMFREEPAEGVVAPPMPTPMPAYQIPVGEESEEEEGSAAPMSAEDAQAVLEDAGLLLKRALKRGQQPGAQEEK